MPNTIDHVMCDADREAQRMKRALDRFGAVHEPSELEARRLDYELRRFTRRLKSLTAKLKEPLSPRQAQAA